MKTEVYLFVPYQGQFRFGYKNDAPGRNRVSESNSKYDNALGVTPGSRATTCRELLHSRMGDDWTSRVEKAFNEIRETLDKGAPNSKLTVNLGPALLNMNPNKKAPSILVHFVRVL